MSVHGPLWAAPATQQEDPEHTFGQTSDGVVAELPGDLGDGSAVANVALAARRNRLPHPGEVRERLTGQALTHP